MPPHLGRIERKGKPYPRRVFFQPPPVPLVRERFALKNAHRREQSPAVHEPRLPGRKPRLADGNNPIVVKNISMNQVNLVRGLAAMRTVF